MSDQSGAKPRGKVLIWALWGAALLGVAAVLYIMVQSSTKPTPEKASAEAAAPAAPAMKTVIEKFQQAEGAGPAPGYVFKDPAGKTMKIADLQGKVVVLNLWATWCGPCKVEMPTLAKLAAEYAGKPVEVVAVSIDDAEDAEKARAFIAGHAPLKFYSDPESKLAFEFTPPVTGMPTTFVYGKDGVERGRVAGEANWAGPDAKAIIDRILAEG